MRLTLSPPICRTWYARPSPPSSLTPHNWTPGMCTNQYTHTLKSLCSFSQFCWRSRDGGSKERSGRVRGLSQVPSTLLRARSTNTQSEAFNWSRVSDRKSRYFRIHLMHSMAFDTFSLIMDSCLFFVIQYPCPLLGGTLVRPPRYWQDSTGTGTSGRGLCSIPLHSWVWLCGGLCRWVCDGVGVWGCGGVRVWGVEVYIMNSIQ